MAIEDQKEKKLHNKITTSNIRGYVYRCAWQHYLLYDLTTMFLFFTTKTAVPTTGGYGTPQIYPATLVVTDSWAGQIQS